MSCRIVNLEKGLPSLEDARRCLMSQLRVAQDQGVKLLKVIHGYGSSGAGGVLSIGIRKSLRLRVKEGLAVMIVPGERFSTDTNETRELLQRYPALRRDSDLNRANPGITIVELAG